MLKGGQFKDLIPFRSPAWCPRDEITPGIVHAAVVPRARIYEDANHEQFAGVGGYFPWPLSVCRSC